MLTDWQRRFGIGEIAKDHQSWACPRWTPSLTRDLCESDRLVTIAGTEQILSSSMTAGQLTYSPLKP